MSVTIRVPWDDEHKKDYYWNELLAWTVETYGLPNEAWSYHPTADYMDFHFKTENDAMMFQLKTGGLRWDLQEQAIELMGVYVSRYQK